MKKCEDGGLSEVICYFNFGLLDHKETLRAMEPFAREVMPHFAEKEGIRRGLISLSPTTRRRKPWRE